MKKKKSSRVWDYLAWIVLSGILVWIILKMVGVIHTPLIVEYAPLFGAVYLAGWAMHKLDRATEDIAELRHDMRYSEKKIGKIDTQIGRQNGQIDSLESDMILVKSSLSQISDKIGI